MSSACGFIDSEHGLIESFVKRWSYYVNDGIFITANYPPKNLGLSLPTIIISSIIFHSLIYVFGSDWFSKKYSITFKKKIAGEEKERKEWNSRIVSNVHALISSLISLYCIVFIYLPSPNIGILSRSDNASLFMIGYCVGYFIYDMFIVIRNYPHLGGMETVIHHSLSMMALLGTAIWEKCVILMVIMMFTEISTPFVNQRYFFSKCNMKDSKLYAYNGILMWLSFGVARISICFYVPHLIWKDSETWCSFPIGWIILVILMFLSISILNIYWFYKITMGLIQVVFPKKGSIPSTSSTPSTPDHINEQRKDEEEEEEEMDEKTGATLALIRR